MATPEKNATPEPATAKPAPGKKKRGKLWIIVTVVVLLGGGGGAWYALAPKAHATTAAVKPPLAAPIYYKFDPAFVVNFGASGSARYLQITLQAMARDPAVIETIKANEPAIRNDLILLFSSQDYANLITEQGKQQLRDAALTAIRKVVAEEGGNPKPVEAVYFTSFVIQ